MYNDKLRLSKKKLRIAQMLYWGSLVGSILSVFPDGPGLWFFVCLILCLVGGFRIDSMYRCPKCSHTLFVHRGDALINKPCDFCPKCGWEVTIEMEA